MAAPRLLVLGATGGTGREVVRQAVAAGFAVTAIVRDPAKLDAAASSVAVVRGDLLADPSVLPAAVASQDAVISALGAGQSFNPRGLIARAAPAIVTAMQEHGVHRLVFMSSFGVGATLPDAPLLPRFFFSTLLRRVYADKDVGEGAIRGSDLDWTIVLPVKLTDAPPTGQYRVGERLHLSGVFPSISRADVADLMVRQVTDRRFVRKTVVVAR